MKKSIGAKLIGLLSIMLVVFMIMISCVWLEVNNMNKVSNRLSNTYLNIEKDLGIVTTMVQSQMKRSMLMENGIQESSEMVEMLGGDCIGECQQIETAIEEMMPLIEGLNDPQLSEPYMIIAENAKVIVKSMPLIYEAYLNGDIETADTLKNSSLQGQTIQIEAANQTLQEILTEAVAGEQNQLMKQKKNYPLS